jgi:hypothetical protein
MSQPIRTRNVTRLAHRLHAEVLREVDMGAVTLWTETFPFDHPNFRIRQSLEPPNETLKRMCNETLKRMPKEKP